MLCPRLIGTVPYTTCPHASAHGREIILFLQGLSFSSPYFQGKKQKTKNKKSINNEHGEPKQKIIDQSKSERHCLTWSHAALMKKSESAVYPSDDSSALKFVAATAL